MEDKKGFGSLERKVVAFSMKDSKEIKLFLVEKESSVPLSENGVDLGEVIQDRNVEVVYFPHPLGSPNPVQYWFERFPSPSVNGNSSEYEIIEEKSPQARELENYGVRVKSHGELV